MTCSAIAGSPCACTIAVHSGKREPRGPVALAIGYVIEAGPATVYFAGDTDIFPGMADLVPGELDVALIPVWGWGLVLGDGHLNPVAQRTPSPCCSRGTPCRSTGARSRWPGCTA